MHLVEMFRHKLMSCQKTIVNGKIIVNGIIIAFDYLGESRPRDLPMQGGS